MSGLALTTIERQFASEMDYREVSDTIVMMKPMAYEKACLLFLVYTVIQFNINIIAIIHRPIVLSP